MNKKEKKYPMLSVRVSFEEKARIKDLAIRIIEKNPYLTEADVVRELLSLTNTGLITTDIREWLSHHETASEIFTIQTTTEQPSKSLKENIGVIVSPNLKHAIENESKTLGITTGTYARQLLVLGWKSRHQITEKASGDITDIEIQLPAFNLDKDDQDLSRYVEKIIPFIRSVPKPLRAKLLDIIDISFDRKESHEHLTPQTSPLWENDIVVKKKEVPDKDETIDEIAERYKGMSDDEIEADALKRFRSGKKTIIGLDDAELENDKKKANG